MTSWIKRGDDVTAWSFVSFIPSDLFHSPSISRLGMITEAGFNPKHGNGNRYLWCSVFMNNCQFIRAQIQIDDIHSMIQESLTCLPQDYIFSGVQLPTQGSSDAKQDSLCVMALSIMAVSRIVLSSFVFLEFLLVCNCGLTREKIRLKVRWVYCWLNKILCKAICRTNTCVVRQMEMIGTSVLV